MKRSGFNLQQESIQKDEASSFVKKQPAGGRRKKLLAEKEQIKMLKQNMIKDKELEKFQVQEEGMHVEALQTKYPIIDWEVYSEDTMKFWKIIRVGNHTESLVQERFNSPGLTEDKEKELWVKLKMLFKPDEQGLLELQRYMHDPLKWWLSDACGVHHVSTERGQDIFMLIEKDYPLTKRLATLMLCNKLRVDQYSDMADELLQKINIIANMPR
ncbi:hypothetical protein Tco_1060561 [Tanacetum coccineum]